ncbi:secreted Ly-6/uPAR-related protein 1 [Loxodonta africana]|uniref:secreted Ly-6/uPAR-related protein 1 n=1 Tax=Elephas maximus indicus TaxID=99487 RepID=UPI0021166A62|nr:secreted Ly-6/uPAR-related protein 1 [Elephas maximus indicus]
MASSWATLSLLLLAAWSVGRGAAFKCYTCQNPTVSALCKNVTYCKPDATACMTTVVTVESEYPFNGSPVVTRSCSTSCVATDPDSFGALHPIYCCFHNLCNVEG